MGSIYKHHIYNHESQSLRPIKNHQTSTYQPPSLTSDPGFAILAIAVLCIMATAFLLVSYYIFLTKCCPNWQQLHPLRRLSTLRPPRNDDPSTAYSPSWQGHGLDDSLIREIPTFQYGGGGERRSLCECVVCLNEFQELDMLRVLPNCGHGFHLDCIDIWLQTNANCPLCRSSISGAKRYPIDRLVAPSSSPQDPRPFLDTLIGGGDEDYVVIELGGADRTVMQLEPRRQQQQQPQPERNESMELQLMLSRVRLPRKFEPKPAKRRKFLSSMGDECVDMREKDDRFSVEQPIRRSFSMDSADDRRVYLAVQEIRQQQNEHLGNSEGSSSSRVRRSFFPFGHGRGSRSAVLPIEF